MADGIRVGVIGTSWWADLAHLPMFKADSRVDLMAICGRNRERAQEMATKYGIPHVFSDYRDMISDGNLQAVVVSTPDDEHYAMTMSALEAGLHVLCEKPLALNAEDAKAMYEKAQAKAVCHMAFFTWRWMPHYRYIRTLLEQDVIGRIYHAQISFLMGGVRNTEYSWRFDHKRAHGVIGDSGSHMFDLAQYLIGDINRVNARLVSNIQRKGLDGQLADSASDAATAMIEFVGGAHGTIEVSMIARVDDPFFEQQVALYGESGTIIGSFKPMSTLEVRFAKGDEAFQTLTIPSDYLQGIDISQPLALQLVPMFSQQPIGCRLFIDAILQNHTVSPNFYDGWKTQRVIDAAIASHKQGRWIDI